ncbi:MAG: hypothetical protein CVU71_08360 [Deltaproteobacteria bacterium HGW-Deltaproteobacteria-6]|nr:MAG: hypothetical protein CVU71_08360 [Deltaproteobacteria bacterium HGW-Deltaproteobacteria-6]
MLKRDEARKIIEVCCEAALPAVIVSLESAAFCRGNFASAQKTDLSFHLASGQSPTGAKGQADFFEPAAVCSVSFMVGSRGCVFLSVIKRIEGKDGAGEAQTIVLEYPDQLVLAERRRSFRVDVARDSGLTAVIKCGTRVMKTHGVNNISYDGMQMEAPEGEEWTFPLGSQVQVELRMDVHQVVVEGEIRRKTRANDGKNDAYVILFFKSFSGGIVEPPADLQKLVKTLDLLAIRRTGK